MGAHETSLIIVSKTLGTNRYFRKGARSFEGLERLLFLGRSKHLRIDFDFPPF